MIKNSATTIDEYIALFPAATQQLLEKMRAIIRKASPSATEKISYGIPTFYLKGNLVHFAAYKNHIGFYPGRSVVTGLELALNNDRVYITAKGTIQFPLDKPLPVKLISSIVKFRVKENVEKDMLKKIKK